MDGARQHFTNAGRAGRSGLIGTGGIGACGPSATAFHGGKGIANSRGVLLVYEYHLAGGFFYCSGQGLSACEEWVLAWALRIFACLPW